MSDDPLRDALESIPPADVIPTRPTDAADLIEIIRMEGHDVTVSMPGEITLDADGTPTGINPPTFSTATVGTVHLTGEQWETVARYLIEKENSNDQ